MSEQVALELAPVPGIRLGTVSAGIKTQGRKDLVLIEVAPGSYCAAVFTLNAFCAAPVTVARENLQDNAEAKLKVLEDAAASAQKMTSHEEADLKVVAFRERWTVVHECFKEWVARMVSDD